jgi:hypothetical protein
MTLQLTLEWEWDSQRARLVISGHPASQAQDNWSTLMNHCHHIIIMHTLTISSAKNQVSDFVTMKIGLPFLHE